MAKKIEDKQPVITRLNLPISDESLMVDLPDGQKLVIGKMSAGSVIEVATWRGTGRPDSRTTRMMLGMSGSAADEASPEPEKNKSAAAAGNSPVEATLKFLKSQFVKDVKSSRELAKVPEVPAIAERTEATTGTGKNKSRLKLKKPVLAIVKKQDFAPRNDSRTESDSAFDIDAWLADIKVKSARKIEVKKAAETRAKATPTKTVSKPSSLKKSTPKKKAQQKKSPAKAVKGRNTQKGKGRGR